MISSRLFTLLGITTLSVTTTNATAEAAIGGWIAKTSGAVVLEHAAGSSIGYFFDRFGDYPAILQEADEMIANIKYRPGSYNKVRNFLDREIKHAEEVLATAEKLAARGKVPNEYVSAVTQVLEALQEKSVGLMCAFDKDVNLRIPERMRGPCMRADHEHETSEGGFINTLLWNKEVVGPTRVDESLPDSNTGVRREGREEPVTKVAGATFLPRWMYLFEDVNLLPQPLIVIS